MNVKKRLLIPYAILAGTIALIVFLVVRNQQLENELSGLDEELTRARQKLEGNQTIRTSDSLLIQGRYADALEAYQSDLANSDSGRQQEIEFRINLAQRLLYFRNQTRMALDSLEENYAVEDTTENKAFATPEELRQYDSLLFALERSNVQLDLLRRQLEQKSSGTYLTIKSSKGNTMHYVGEVKNGKAHGQGIAILNTGSRYVGEWKDNMRHGQGAFYWPDGEHYNGSYVNDRRSGKGSYFWPSGEKFTGEWENDQRNGQGTFYGPEGDVVAKGMWKNDELVEVEDEG